MPWKLKGVGLDRARLGYCCLTVIFEIDRNTLNYSKITFMKFKSASPMVTTTMVMRSKMQMTMFCRAEWKAR
jgi:hypothetical protein